MRKLVGLTTFLELVLAVACLAWAQDENKLELNTDDTCVKPGDTVTVRLDVSNLQQPVNGCQIVVDYDSSIVTLKTAVVGDSPWAELVYPVPPQTPPPLCVSAVVWDEAGTKADGTVLVMTFTASAEGQADLCLLPGAGVSRTLLSGVDGSEIDPALPAECTSVNIDTKPPEITGLAVSPCECTNADEVCVTWSIIEWGCGVDYCEVSIDNGPPVVTDAPYCFSTAGLAEGQHTVSVTCMDLAGNDATEQTTFKLDTTPPQITNLTIDPSGCTNAGTIVMSWDCSDAGCGVDHCEVSVDGGAPVSTSSPYAFSTAGLADGDHTVTVTCVDSACPAGNTASKSATFTLDKTAPLIADLELLRECGNGSMVPLAPGGFTNADEICVTWSVSETGCAGAGVCQVTVAGGPPVEATSPFCFETVGIPDGEVVVAVSASDALGNTAQESVTVNLDRTPPESFVVTVDPECPTYVNGGILVSYNTTDALSGVDHYEVKVDDEPFVDVDHVTLMFISTSLMAVDGQHTVYVKAVDGAGCPAWKGNGQVESATFCIDNTPPVIGDIDVGPPCAEDEICVDWTCQDETSGVDYCMLSVDGIVVDPNATPLYCFSSLALNLDDGEHTVTITCVDLSVRSGTNPATKSATFTVDRKPPTIADLELDPDCCTSADEICATWTIDDAGCGVDYCTLSVDDVVIETNAISPHCFSTAGLADGQHTVAVTCVDHAGNEVREEVDFDLDKTPPVISDVVLDPDCCTNADSISVSWDCSDAGCGVDYCEVSIDGAAAVTAASPYSISTTGLGDGDHTVTIRCVDQACPVGNEASQDRTFTIDKTPPVVSNVVLDPDCCTNADSISVSWDCSDAGCGVDYCEVSIDGGAPITAASPYSIPTGGLSDGDHTVTIRCVDEACPLGNAASEDRTFTIDKTPPVISNLVLDPDCCTNADNILLSWDCSDAGCGVDYCEVSIDGGAAVTTASPYTILTGGLADGDHTVAIRCVDQACPVGNEASENRTFTIDTTPPVISDVVLNPDCCTNEDSISVSWDCTDAGCGVDYCEVSIDGGLPVTAASPYSISTTGLGDGDHTVTIRCVDQACPLGNAASENRTFTIDKTPPVISNVVLDPDCCTNAESILVSWDCTDAGCGVDYCEVSIDGGAAVTAASPHSISTAALGDGDHTVTIRCVDVACPVGNEASKNRTFTIDTTPPVIANLELQPSGCTNADLIVVTWDCSDAGCGVDYCEVSIDGGMAVVATSPYDLSTSALGDGDHTVTVGCVDLACPVGNEASEDRTFTIDKTPPVISITSVEQDGRDLLSAGELALQGDVTITVEADDAGCGLAGMPAVIVTPEGCPAEDITGTGQEVSPGVFEYTYSVEECTCNGIAGVEACVSDNAGNGPACDDASFQIDKCQITGLVQLSVAPPAGGAARAATFEAFEVVGSDHHLLKTWVVDLLFDQGETTAEYTLTAVPPATAKLCVKPLGYLTRCKEVSFDLCCQAAVDFTASDDKNPLPGDVNGDDCVNVLDFSHFRMAWLTGEGSPGYDPAADSNADGKVNLLDYLKMKSHWYQCGEKLGL